VYGGGRRDWCEGQPPRKGVNKEKTTPQKSLPLIIPGGQKKGRDTLTREGSRKKIKGKINKKKWEAGKGEGG